MVTKGCPVCSWDGRVAITHDSTHEYYTHIIVKNGEVFNGKKCSMRTKEASGLMEKFFF